MAELVQIKEKFENLSELFQALGDEKRQKVILKLLEQNSCAGLQVGELTHLTGLSRPAVSHHLKILRDAKLIDYYSKARRNYYFVCADSAELHELSALIKLIIEYTKEQEKS